MNTYSNYTSAVELSRERNGVLATERARTERESQEERWQFEMDEIRRLEPERLMRNENASPVESLIQQQYNLSLALVSAESLREYQSEENPSEDVSNDECSEDTNNS